MYTVEAYKKPYARIIDSDTYASDFLAGSLAEGQLIAVDMNKPEMLSALADYRYEIETSGLELDGGMRLLTDRESQAQLSSTYTDLKYGLIPDTDWKAANGWEVVNLEQMEPIAKALAVHRRACFRGERVVITAIENAKTLALQVAIDIKTDFMTAYQAAVAEVMTPEQAPE